MSDLEGQLERQKELNADLLTAKDKASVSAILAAHNGADELQDQFDALIDDVKMARPDEVPNVVFLHILMDRFDKAGKIEWFDYREEFTVAVQRNLLSEDDGYPVRWSSKKLAGLGKALDAVQAFVGSENGEELMQSWDAAVPEEPDDIDFWKHHLNI